MSGRNVPAKDTLAIRLASQIYHLLRINYSFRRNDGGNGRNRRRWHRTRARLALVPGHAVNGCQIELGKVQVVQARINPGDKQAEKAGDRRLERSAYSGRNKLTGDAGSKFELDR